MVLQFPCDHLPDICCILFHMFSTQVAICNLTLILALTWGQKSWGCDFFLSQFVIQNMNMKNYFGRSGGSCMNPRICFKNNTPSQQWCVCSSIDAMTWLGYLYLCSIFFQYFIHIFHKFWTRCGTTIVKISKFTRKSAALQAAFF